MFLFFLYLSLSNKYLEFVGFPLWRFAGYGFLNMYYSFQLFGYQNFYYIDF